jgi:hypothetical protein
MAGIEGMLAEIISEFPSFRLVRKGDSRLMLTIDRFLKILTFGHQSRFLSEYHTVIGYTLYVAPTWNQLDVIEQTILLRHERVHMRQRRKWGLIGLAFLYLVPLLPIGLAYGRARLEWQAYSETIRASVELRGLDVLNDRALREMIVRRFIGPDYAWMWPFRRSVESWYDRLVLQIRQNTLSRRHASERVTVGSSSGAFKTHNAKES